MNKTFSEIMMKENVVLQYLLVKLGTVHVHYCNAAWYTN